MLFYIICWHFRWFWQKELKWKLKLFKKNDCHYCDKMRNILRRIKYIFNENGEISIFIKDCSYPNTCTNSGIFSVPQLILYTKGSGKPIVYNGISSVISVYNWLTNITNIYPLDNFIQIQHGTQEMVSQNVDKGNCVFGLLDDGFPPSNLYTDLDTYVDKSDFIPLLLRDYHQSLFSGFIQFGSKIKLLNISSVESFISYIDYICYGPHRASLREYVRKLLYNETTNDIPDEFTPQNPETIIFTQKMWSNSIDELNEKLQKTQATLEKDLSKEMRNQLKQRNFIMKMLIELKLENQSSLN